jgi:hypothetical protein
MRGAARACMTRRQGELSLRSEMDAARSTSALSDAAGAVSRLLGETLSVILAMRAEERMAAMLVMRGCNWAIKQAHAWQRGCTDLL